MILWSDFVDAVDDHLAVEGVRRGTEAFRTRQIRNAVLDLQRNIDSYREANATIYAAADLTVEGRAQLVTLPEQAIPTGLYLYDATATDPLCRRNQMDRYPWGKRSDLICGSLNFATWWGCWLPIGGCPTPPDPGTCEPWCTGRAYVYAMSPMARNLLIYPQVTDSTRLLLVWDGFRYTFDPSDEVPYPENASEAVAYYVMEKIAQFVDKDSAQAQARGLMYRQKRLELIRDARDQRDQITGANAEEFGANIVAP